MVNKSLQQFKAVLMIMFKSTFRQKQLFNTIIFQLIISLALPLLYSFAYKSMFDTIFKPHDIDDHPATFLATDISEKYALGYDSNEPFGGDVFGRQYIANNMVTTSNKIKDLQQFIEEDESDIGVTFTQKGNDFMMQKYTSRFPALLLALSNQRNSVIYTSMPLSYYEKAKEAYIFTAVYSIFLQYAVMVSVFFLQHQAECRIERRTAVIMYNGGKIMQWHLYWAGIVSIIMFLTFALIFAILALCQVDFALVNPLIWLPELALFSIQNTLLVMCFMLCARTKEQIQTVMGLSISLVFFPSAILILTGQYIPNWAFIILSILPCFPFNQVVNAMSYNGYSDENLSLGQIYNKWNLTWCIVMQIVYVAVLYYILIKVDTPLKVSTCSTGTVAPDSVAPEEGFFNKNVRQEVIEANKELLKQKQDSAVMFFNVTKNFDDVKANDRITLCIPKGKITGILGPNSAGKSTLLNALFKAHKLDEGDVFVNGISVRHSSPNIGICLQDNTSLFDYLTVEENIAVYSAFARTPCAVNMFGLNPKQIANTLSGGMKRRLALSCSLVNKPEILVMDEPSAGVDPNGRKELWELIKNQAPTIISTTHMLDEASTYFDRVAFIMKGKLVCVGNVKELQGTGISCTVQGKLDPDNKDFQLVGSGQNRINSYRTSLKYSQAFQQLIEKKAKREIAQFEINAQSFDWIYLELSQQVWKQ